MVTRRGDLAVLWAPYEFQLNGKTTHCGVDVFNLLKSDGRWKIAGASWTVEPDACAELTPKTKREGAQPASSSFRMLATRPMNTSTAKGLVIISMPGSRKPPAMAAFAA